MNDASGRVVANAPVLMVILLWAGCSTTPPQSELQARMDAGTMSADELELALFDYVLQTSHHIELAADRIAGRAECPEVRLQAWEWKVTAPPALRVATWTDVDRQRLKTLEETTSAASAALRRFEALIVAERAEL
jgi:hypothetical protein